MPKKPKQTKESSVGLMFCGNHDKAALLMAASEVIDYALRDVESHLWSEVAIDNIQWLTDCLLMALPSALAMWRENHAPEEPYEWADKVAAVQAQRTAVNGKTDGE